MQLHKRTPWLLILFCAMLMAIAPQLDMSVERMLKPDILDLGGYAYQLIGRTFASLSDDSLTSALLLIATFFLAKRYLFHKPKQTGIGEYLLCGFFSLCMLTSASIRATGSVQTLYENAFQIVKVGLYLGGMFPLFLCAVRGLNELMHYKSASPLSQTKTLWDAHPFWFPFGVLSLAWSFHIIGKYPGVIHMDVVMPIRQFIGITTWINDFPIFDCVCYGLAYQFGQAIGNINLVYFVIMLLQVIPLLFVLSYVLWFFKTKQIPKCFLIACLILFAISPIYIGWAVTIGKDARYMVLSLLLTMLTIECLEDVHAFFFKKSRWVLLTITCILLIWTRSNGLFVVVPMLIIFVILRLKHHLPKRSNIAFLLLACLIPIGSQMASNGLTNLMNVQQVHFYDYLSIPFQQTARVAYLYGDTLTEEEEEAVNTMIAYDMLAELYNPTYGDSVKEYFSRIERGQNSPDAYLSVWFKQLLLYPMDYLDAFLNMNYVMFDLQSNEAIYQHYTDVNLYTNQYAFHETEFFDLEQIRPLLSTQFALTEWYYDFAKIPVIGWFATMGFCNLSLLAVCYLSYVNNRKRVLIIAIPALLTMLAGAFCPIVYVRYFLPTMACLPLCFLSGIPMKGGKKS